MQTLLAVRHRDSGDVLQLDEKSCHEGEQEESKDAFLPVNSLCASIMWLDKCLQPGGPNSV